eukprot:TRINITY_DN3729_c0_g3_i3.p1 TRINITY_DN3729_c0_g3~~TRINITY_DN3729_c0_g3_i3.p1  ORF type:complete len:460 (+),score=170.73 TRINITY_DN3729_c0_g3_i3:519-1898(+)
MWKFGSESGDVGVGRRRFAAEDKKAFEEQAKVERARYDAELAAWHQTPEGQAELEKKGAPKRPRASAGGGGGGRRDPPSRIQRRLEYAVKEMYVPPLRRELECFDPSTVPESSHSYINKWLQRIDSMRFQTNARAVEGLCRRLQDSLCSYIYKQRHKLELGADTAVKAEPESDDSGSDQVVVVGERYNPNSWKEQARRADGRAESGGGRVRAERSEAAPLQIAAPSNPLLDSDVMAEMEKQRQLDEVERLKLQLSPVAEHAAAPVPVSPVLAVLEGTDDWSSDGSVGWNGCRRKSALPASQENPRSHRRPSWAAAAPCVSTLPRPSRRADEARPSQAGQQPAGRPRGGQQPAGRPRGGQQPAGRPTSQPPATQPPASQPTSQPAADAAAPEPAAGKRSRSRSGSPRRPASRSQSPVRPAAVFSRRRPEADQGQDASSSGDELDTMEAVARRLAELPPDE